jgi:hypothetical protein
MVKRSGLLIPALVIGLALAGAAGAVAMLQATGSETNVTPSRSYLPAGSIEDITKRSSIVVIATLEAGPSAPRTEPVRKEDGSPDGNRASIKQDYEVSVERYLKGDGQTVLTLTQVIGYDDGRRGPFNFERSQTPALESGVRYVLFLRTALSGGLVATAEPWRFVLADRMATVQSHVQFREGSYPQIPEDEMISRISAGR